MKDLLTRRMGMLWCLATLCALVWTVHADSLSGLSQVTMDGGNNGLVDLTYGGTTYVVADGDLTSGETRRYYVVGGVETWWPDGDPAPAATVTGTSDPKVGDTGAKADNFLFRKNGATDISSIDGIDFQETIFPYGSRLFFVFERGGNDKGTVQAVMPGGGLGPALTLTANGAPYANTGVAVNGQNAFGFVLQTDTPAIGIRITASGHDALVVCIPTRTMFAVPIYPMPLPDDLGKNVPANMTFEWTFETDSDIRLRDYVLYMDADQARVQDPSGGGLLINGVTVMPASPTDGAAQYAYSGIAEDTTYYWRVDTRIFEPNDTSGLYDIPSTVSGAVWSFMGVLPVPVITQEATTVYLLPDPDSHAFLPVETPSFTVGFEGGRPVAGIKWFKNGFECTGPEFQIENSLDEALKTSTLIINIDTSAPAFGAFYEGDYHCQITLDNAESAVSETAQLVISDVILAHRWSFNGELSDSIGGADAVIVDPGERNIDLTAQEVVFGGVLAAGDNQTSDDPNLHYIDLPNGIVSALGDHATFMLWYTIEDPAVPNNVRVLTLGDADGSGTEAEWVFNETTQQWGWSGMTGDGPWIEIVTRDGNISYGSRSPGAVAVNDGPAADFLNREICVAGVWDGSAGQMSLHIDGTFSGAVTPNRKLSDLVDVNNWLGRSNSTADKTFVGRINEVRIYDVPLNAAWITALYALGPDGEAKEPAVVNPCVNPPDKAFDVNEDCRIDLADLVQFILTADEGWLSSGRLYGTSFPQ